MNTKEQAAVLRYEDPLKSEYARILEWAFIVALVILLTVFFAWQKFRTGFMLPEVDTKWKVKVLDIPRTVQLKQPPRPAIPSVPVPEEDMDLVEDVTLSYNNIDFKKLTESTPPPSEEIEEVPFIKVAVKPKIIKEVAPIYPPLARKAGVEGLVVVKVLIDTKGNAEKVEILKSIPMLDNAAIAAAKQFKFSPGRQRDRYVKVWMSIPFKFKLK